jgi:hypothetical protein
MKNVMRSLLFLLLFFLIPFLADGLAEEKPRTDQFLNEFEEIKTRLANIEKQQQDVAAKDVEILERLDQLRIWVHRK